MPSILAPLKVFASGAVGAQRAEVGADGVVVVVGRASASATAASRSSWNRRRELLDDTN